MDFWDLTKLLARRWYFTVPLLLVTAALTVNVAVTVKPDYVATTNLQLIPPPALPETTPKPGVRPPNNPWLELGLTALAQNASLALQGKEVIDGLKTAGLSDNYTLTVGDLSPLVAVEVIGRTEAQATATLEQLANFFEVKVDKLQKDQNASSQLIIKVSRIQAGDNVKADSTKVARSAVIVGAVGVLLTMGFSVMMDALLRRRLIRRMKAADIDLSPQGDGGWRSSQQPPPQQTPSYVDSPPPSFDQTALIRTMAPSPSSGMPPLDVEYHAGGDSRLSEPVTKRPVSSTSSRDIDLDDLPVPPMAGEDETIILPLSNSGRSSRDSKRN